MRPTALMGSSTRAFGNARGEHAGGRSSGSCRRSTGGCHAIFRNVPHFFGMHPRRHFFCIAQPASRRRERLGVPPRMHCQRVYIDFVMGANSLHPTTATSTRTQAQYRFPLMGDCPSQGGTSSRMAAFVFPKTMSSICFLKIQVEHLTYMKWPEALTMLTLHMGGLLPVASRSGSPGI